eukprot:5593-Prorocentrum_minimum.AAC.1
MAVSRISSPGHTTPWTSDAPSVRPDVYNIHSNDYNIHSDAYNIHSDAYNIHSDANLIFTVFFTVLRIRITVLRFLKIGGRRIPYDMTVSVSGVLSASLPLLAQEDP